jgi:hypothetical protein
MSRITTAAALYWAAFAAGLAWTAWLMVHSPGTPVQDEIGHLLISRSAWHVPAWLLNVWGRPAHTLLYLLPALGGLEAARLFSLAMSALIVLVATGIARRLGATRLWLVPVCLWFQPWHADLSYTAITEIPFSLFVAAGAWLWLGRRWNAAGLVLGLLPLARHEGILIAVAAALAGALRRDWKAAALPLVPFALYNLLYYLAFGRWVFRIFLAPTPTQLYGSGTWWHYLPGLIDNVGVPVLALSALGLLALIAARPARRKALALAPYAIYLAAHVVLYRFGLYASGGYDLFLLPLAPGFAILAAIGFDRAADWLRSLAGRIHGAARARTALAAAPQVAIAAGAALVIGAGLGAQPRPLDAEGAYAEQAARWLEAQRLDSRSAVSTHVWFLYHSGAILARDWSNPPPLDDLPPGAIVVWDQHYADRWGLPYDRLSDPAGPWRLLKRFGPDQAADAPAGVDPLRGVYAIFQKR